MAVNYTNLFTEIGQPVKTINQLRGTTLSGGGGIPDLPALQNALEAALVAGTNHEMLDTVDSMFVTIKDGMIGFGDLVSDWITRRLTQRDRVLEVLDGIGNNTDVQSVLLEIYRDMLDQGETINRSTVTLGAVSADASNSGNGVVLLDKVLDGVTPPVAGSVPNILYAGEDSELAVKGETMTWTCITDEDSDGVASGEEVFLWQGTVLPVSPFGWRQEGSGVSVNVPTLNTHTIIANKDFDSWSGDVPESWDVDEGVGGTDIVQESLTADVHRGTSALRFVGDGATNPQISQTIPLRLLIPNRRYLLAVYVKADAAIAAGTLTIQFESPSGGYVAAGSEQIVLNSAALSAQNAYGLEFFYINMPAQIPEDMELVIKMTGGLDAGKNVWVDSLAFGPVVYANGINSAIVAGSDAFTRSDRFTSLILNNDAGVFQTYFRKQFRVQLPSDALPTISDGLAT